MIDLAGPITVKGFQNKRTSRKTWIVLVTCLASRAVLCYLAEDYSTDSLLTVLAKHEARNGSPKVYYADLGTQIRGADRVKSEIVDEISKLDKNEMESWGEDRGVQFSFGSPHFPQGQGAIERLVAEIKKELKFVTKNRTFSFGQLDAALAECSYLVNTRPLQLHPGPGGEEGFICPNDLLMGRSDKAPPIGEFESSSLTKKVQFMRSVVLQFWERWYTSYFQRLVKYHKWKCKSRNAREGDVVLILDRESPKGKFTIGEISSTKKDPDGIVRRVIVRYKLHKSDDDRKKPAVEKFLERNVRSLALVLTAEERSDLKSDNPIEIDTFEINNERVDNATFDSKVPSDIETVKEDSNYDEDVHDQDTQELPREVKKLVADNVGSDNGPTVRDGEEAEPTSSGRKRWKVKKFGF